MQFKLHESHLFSFGNYPSGHAMQIPFNKIFGGLQDVHSVSSGPEQFEQTGLQLIQELLS